MKLKVKQSFLILFFVLVFPAILLAQHTEELIEYWPNGTVKSVEPVVNGEREGLATYTHENGELYGKIPWTKGQKNGSFTLYRADGSKEQDLSYLKGKRHGIFIWYNEKGMIYAKDNLINDQLNGKSIRYYPNGNKKTELYYNNDRLHGLNLWYYENGNLKVSAHYENGELHGQIKRYEADGTMSTEGEYKNGQLVWGDDGKVDSGKEDYMNIIFEYIVPILVWILIIFFGGKKKMEQRKKSGQKGSGLTTLKELMEKYKVKGVEFAESNDQPTEAESVPYDEPVDDFSVQPISQGFGADYLPQLKEAFLTARTVWLSLFSTIFIYAGVIYFYCQSAKATYLSEEQAGLIKYSLLAASLGILVLVKVFQSVILDGRSGVYDGQTEEKKDALKLTARLKASAVMASVMCEAPATAGLVFTLLTADMSQYYVFAVLSIVGFFIYTPKFDEWEQWINNRLIGY